MDRNAQHSVLRHLAVVIAILMDGRVSGFKLQSRELSVESTFLVTLHTEWMAGLNIQRFKSNAFEVAVDEPISGLGDERSISQADLHSIPFYRVPLAEDMQGIKDELHKEHPNRSLIPH